MSIEDINKGYFDFLRRRTAFVSAHISSDAIEAYVVWGAAVDSLMRIHGRRLGRDLDANRRCFVQGLLDLTPALGTISIPLLAHDLHQLAPMLCEQPPISAYVSAARSSRVWRTEEDAAAATQLATLRQGQPHEVQHAFDGNRYTDILYTEYRCCAVHGLELGMKTLPKFAGPEEPGYTNYLYADDDPRPASKRYRTRIVFPLAWLARLLNNMITNEERACAGWQIPAYPTLLD